MAIDDITSEPGKHGEVTGKTQRARVRSRKATVGNRPVQAESDASDPPPAAAVEANGKASPKDTLDPKETLHKFSSAASDLLYVLVNRYLVDLERLSRWKAKSGALETVSKQHVEQAAFFLSYSRSPSKKSRYCETAGGVLLGAGIAEMIALAQSPKISPHLLVLTAVLIAVGGVLIGIFLGRD
jgi:hypothetical protein